MSFDLCVIDVDLASTYEEARDVYWKLCDGSFRPTGSLASIHVFCAELSAVYPEIDDVPESQLDRCPWTCRHDKSGEHVIVAVRWDRAEDVMVVVKDLARKYGLVCIDPQNEDVY